MSTENLSGQNNGHGVDFLEQHLGANPDSMLFARLADFYIGMDRVDDAIRLCEDGIKKHPYYATGHFVLGKSYLANKMYEQAEKEFKRVLLFDPKFLAAHKLYGDLMKEIGWENTCEMSYKKILQIDPLDETARSVVEAAEAEEAEGSGPTASAEGEGLDDDPVLQAPPEGEPEVASPVKKEGEEIRPHSLSPVAVSPEEEELLFHSGQPLEADTEDAEMQTVSDQTSLDEQKAEEFSYILDDIFKDEVVERDPGHSTAERKPAAGGKPKMSTEEEAETILAELDLPSKPEARMHVQSGEKEALQHEVEGRSQKTSELRDAAVAETIHAEKQKSAAATGGKGDKIVTPTLGEIYAAQGQYGKAIDVFETLIKKNPDNEFYIKKLEVLKRKLDESKD